MIYNYWLWVHIGWMLNYRRLKLLTLGIGSDPIKGDISFSQIPTHGEIAAAAN